MMEIDFRNCRNKKDVSDRFNKKERELEKEIRNLGKLRNIFMEEDGDKKEEDLK